MGEFGLSIFLCIYEWGMGFLFDEHKRVAGSRCVVRDGVFEAVGAHSSSAEKGWKQQRWYMNAQRGSSSNSPQLANGVNPYTGEWFPPGTPYDASGCMIDIQVTEASDHPVVTNSVTMSDVLGRTAATVTPLGVSSNLYDGATMRVLTTTRTRQPPVQNLYDDLGEQIGRFRVCGGILC